MIFIEPECIAFAKKNREVKRKWRKLVYTNIVCLLLVFLCHLCKLIIPNNVFFWANKHYRRYIYTHNLEFATLTVQFRQTEFCRKQMMRVAQRQREMIDFSLSFPQS